MAISLYTSRVVLNTLGVVDYGVYAIVGGTVTLFGFFNAAMAAATQRFLAFDIGRGEKEKLNNTFNATFIIHIGIATLILVLAETVGLWFIKQKLNIPEERMEAAFWVYHFSVFTFLTGVIQVPFSALIIAREKMNVYAATSVAEVLLRLVIVWLLVVIDFDKLKLYTIFVFFATVIMAVFNQIYCRIKFEESKFRWYYDRTYFQTLVSYSGWNLFGNIAAVASGQGINVVLNLFFGTVVNAAYGVMLQVQGAVNMFVNNFLIAVKPQIIKAFATGDSNRMTLLIFQSSKFSYLLMYIVVIPIVFNTEFVLTLWLKNPPPNAAVFVKLCLINILVDCVSYPLKTGVQATGNIKWYQIMIGTFIIMNLPISYLLLLCIHKPEIPLYIAIFITLFSLVFRLYFLKRLMVFSVKNYLKQVILRLVAVSLVGVVLAEIYIYFYSSNSYLSFIVLLLISLFSSVLIGFSKREKLFVKDYLLKRFSR